MNPKLRHGPPPKTPLIVKGSIDVAGLKTSVSLEAAGLEDYGGLGC